ncbi:hypothetical protein HF324_23805 [Chitinophaga oryzae]|uniref:Uncharacterized protein n=1 Tax=Chitinophaga oryzae TaxID=2725414 RepID=A0ABX6LKL1_9BACT|nr:hypothetical protein [Chitinophaga oryzae]QJB40697.1 hypothetical protein HF324_23805 [Chitinophaga oryzae]
MDDITVNFKFQNRLQHANPFQGQGASVCVGQQWWPPVLRTGVLPAPAGVGSRGGINTGGRRSNRCH